MTITTQMLVVCVACGGAAACATHGTVPAAPVPARQARSNTVARDTTTTVELHGKPLTLHLAQPADPANSSVLVLYASGDGGWFGTAVDMFHEITRAGYAAVGFSSRAFLRIERPRNRTLNPGQLALEYGQILDRAQETLGLPASSRAVLTGWSRGAAFAVLAGGETPLSGRALGVIAIGLSDGEDLAVDAAADDDGEASGAPRKWPFEPYRRLAALGLPCAVIQSSHDQYLPAARGRALFGADTASRKFLTVEATNHRFSGGKPAFDAALRDALHWVAAAPPHVPSITQEIP